MNSINYQNFKLFYEGDVNLLNKPKIAIVGTRKASKYSKEITKILAKALSKKYVIVSGGALGIDTCAHKAAFPNTILVSPASIDVIYPKSNENLIKEIKEKALLISEYEKNFTPYKHTFLQRNRIIIALSEFVIIPEANLNSGSMNSFKWAKEFNKKVFVIPQRLTESSGTRYMARNGAEVIWDIDEFLKQFELENNEKILTLNEALKKYGNTLYEMELEGKVEIKNGKVYF